MRVKKKKNARHALHNRFPYPVDLS